MLPLYPENQQHSLLSVAGVNLRDQGTRRINYTDKCSVLREVFPIKVAKSIIPQLNPFLLHWYLKWASGRKRGYRNGQILQTYALDKFVDEFTAVWNSRSL